MLVYIINCNSKPLMPCSARKARLLLKQKKVRVLKKEPFTIQLLYGSSGYRQKVSLGIDTDSKHIGVSATTYKKELYAADVDMKKVRRHNRQIHKAKILKGGVKKMNQAPYLVKGFQIIR